MSKVINELFSGRHYVLMITFFAVIELINIVCMESYANLLLAIPESIFVLYLLVSNQIENALLFHVIFCLTGLDAVSGTTEEQLMSYPEFKLIGPLTFSYIVLGLIWIRSLKLRIPNEVKRTILFQFRKVVFILMIYGTIVGFFGLCFFEYRLNDFIKPLIYILTGFLLLDILVRMMNPSFLRKCYYCMIYLLIASPPVVCISFFLLNIKAEYSGLDALIFNETFMLAPTLLLFFFYEEKNKILILLSLIPYFICVAVAGRGGFFLNIAAALFIIVYLIYFSKETKKTYIAKFCRILLPLLFVAFLSYLSTLDVSLSLGTRKISELISMFEAIGTLSSAGIDISEISSSPYIRIAETLNILDNGLNNIFGLLFGYGYGGYYTDSTHLFENVDVSIGAFPPEVVNSGKFGAAHSFLPTTLLYNGLVGLFFIVWIGVKYMRKVSYSPLVFAAFTLFFYSFYFNTSLFMAAGFSLFASELKLSYS